MTAFKAPVADTLFILADVLDTLGRHHTALPIDLDRYASGPALFL